MEGQSNHDKYMALRVWEYHVAITRVHLKRGARQDTTDTYLWLYHGKKKWTSPACPKSVADLFEDFDLYVGVSLKAPFLINLTKKEMETLTKQGAAAAPQLIMKGQSIR